MMSGSGKEKSPNKLNFARRCSLLQQYLKEKGSLGDINLELIGKSEAKGKEATVLPGAPMRMPPEKKNIIEMNPRLKKSEHSSDAKSGDFVQKLSDTPNRSDFREPATVPAGRTNAQLTIFFAGKVVVYDEFPADKANEIMDLANQANFRAPADVIVPVKVDPNGVAVPENAISENAVVKNDAGLGNPVIPDLNAPSVTDNNEDPLAIQNQLVERIARRASLHRFFAKRKDRAAARAPYQVNHTMALPPKPDAETRPGPGPGPILEKGQSSGQINKNDAKNVAATSSKPEEAKDHSLGDDQSLKHLELRL